MMHSSSSIDLHHQYPTTSSPSTTATTKTTTQPYSRMRLLLFHLLLGAIAAVYVTFLVAGSVQLMGIRGVLLYSPAVKEQTASWNAPSHFWYSNSNSQKDDTSLLPPMHILYGGHGNHSGFLAEWKTSLKSVLLNAPLDTSLHIHIMVDSVAQTALRHILEQEINLTSWQTRQPLQVHTYNVESHVETWKNQIRHVYRHYPPHLERFRHTMGSYFRLFAHEILLPDHPEIHNVLYMDSDVVILTYLDSLWYHVTQASQQGDYFFQWGSEFCAGFNVIAVPKLPQFWHKLESYDLLTLSGNFSASWFGGNVTKALKAAQKALHQKGLGDQILVRSVQYTEPHLLGTLPEAWDVSAENGPWKYRGGAGLDTIDRPNGVAMMHFNGGGSSPESVFDSHPYLTQQQQETPGVETPVNENETPPSTATTTSSNSTTQNHTTTATPSNESSLTQNDTATATLGPNFDSTWGLAHYYNNMPWKWAQYLVQGRCRLSSKGASSTTQEEEAGAGCYSVTVTHQ